MYSAAMQTAVLGQYHQCGHYKIVKGQMQGEYKCLTCGMETNDLAAGNGQVMGHHKSHESSGNARIFDTYNYLQRSQDCKGIEMASTIRNGIGISDGRDKQITSLGKPSAYDADDEMRDDLYPVDNSYGHLNSRGVVPKRNGSKDIRMDSENELDATMELLETSQKNGREEGPYPVFNEVNKRYVGHFVDCFSTQLGLTANETMIANKFAKRMTITAEGQAQSPQTISVIPIYNTVYCMRTGPAMPVQLVSRATAVPARSIKLTFRNLVYILEDILPFSD